MYDIFVVADNCTDKTAEIATWIKNHAKTKEITLKDDAIEENNNI